jgi:hypothetical protein
MKLQSNRERRQNLKAYNAQGRAVTVTIPTNDETPDELNPAYLFSGTATALLVALASGELNAQALALDMLANRGLDPATGRWVGFDKAKALADAAKDQAGIL